MANLNLSFFNTLDVAVDGKRITHFRSAKVQALLLYLVLEADKVHPRDTLAALLWPDEPQETARKNLRQTLYHLRKLLETNSSEEPLVIVTRQTIQFNDKIDYELDVARFEAAAAAGRFDRVETFYTGQLLPSFECDSHLFAAWLQRKRLGYQQAALEALSQLTEQQLSMGEVAIGRALTLARRQLDLEPWRESAHRQLMRALAMIGDRSGAIAQFDFCAEVLAEELGVSPAPETFTLFEAIRDGAFPQETTTPTSQVLNNIPHQPTPLVGRSTEIDQLTALLLEPTIRLVTIFGSGGMGKTRLATAVAHHLIEDTGKTIGDTAGTFADGLFFVALAPHNDSGKLPELLADSLGLHLHTESKPIDQVLDYLRPKSCLIILDNFEHQLPDGFKYIAKLLDQAPHICLLITSRKRLKATAETVYLLEGLPATDSPDSEAAQLFLQTARRSSTHYAPTRRDRQHVTAICQLVAGVPLAIMMAAGWVDTLPLDQIAARIRTDLDFLSTDEGDLPERQRSMRAVFSYSWALLSPAERLYMAQLGCFRGGFSRAAACAVVGIPLRLLARLIRKSLVQYDIKQERYHLHLLLRQFTLERLSEEGGAAEIGRKHSHYYLTWASENETGLRGSEQILTLQRMVAEQDNLTTAWRWAIEHHAWPLLHDALEALYFLFDFTGRHVAGTQLFEQTRSQVETVMVSAEDGDKQSALLHARLINRLHLLTRYGSQQKIGGVEEMLPLLRQQEAHLEEALALGWLADRAFQAREIPQAIAHFQQQLALLNSVGDLLRTSAALGQFANALLWAGQPDQAVSAVHQSLALARAGSDTTTTSLSFTVLGVSEFYFYGDYRAASGYLDEAMAANVLWSEAGFHTPWLLITIVYQAYVALLNGDLAETEHKTRQALDYATELNATYPRLIADSLESLLKATSGRNQEALAQAANALNRSRQIGSDMLGLQAIALAGSGVREWSTVLRQLLFVWQLSVQANLPNIPMLLALLPMVAAVLEGMGRTERAVQVLAMGRAHAACPHGWWDNMTLVQDLDTRLQKTLSPAAFANAQAMGRDLDTRETARHLLAELSELASQL